MRCSVRGSTDTARTSLRAAGQNFAPAQDSDNGTGGARESKGSPPPHSGLWVLVAGAQPAPARQRGTSHGLHACSRLHMHQARRHVRTAQSADCTQRAWHPDASIPQSGPTSGDAACADMCRPSADPTQELQVTNLPHAPAPPGAGPRPHSTRHIVRGAVSIARVRYCTAAALGDTGPAPRPALRVLGRPGRCSKSSSDNSPSWLTGAQLEFRYPRPRLLSYLPPTHPTPTQHTAAAASQHMHITI